MRNQTSSRKRGRETALGTSNGQRSTRIKTTGKQVSYRRPEDEDDELDDLLEEMSCDMSEAEHLMVVHQRNGSPRLAGSPDHSNLASMPGKLGKQAANGFPVLPPGDSTKPPTAAGAFRQQHPQSNNNNNNNSTGKNSRVSPMKNGSTQATGHANKKTTTTDSTLLNGKEVPPISAHQRRDDEAAAAAALVAASIRRQQMKEAFQPWVMQTYGDAAKTKTISRRKAERIAKILRGEDRSNGADSSKFRFWVRAKGFRLGPPNDLSTSNNSTHPNDDVDDLYVVTSTTKDELGGEDRAVYKKVAVVEDFFDIIYREHVEFMNNSGGRPPTGKHAGQKRTYRAITEIYAFLPREAVTRFLMQCADCQRRGGSNSNTTNTTNVVSVGVASPPSSTQLSPASTAITSHHNGVSPGSPTPPASPATNSKPQHHHHHHHLHPLTTTLLLPPTPPQQQQQQQLPFAMALSAHNIDLSLPLTSTLLKRATIAGVSHQQLLGLDRAEATFSERGTTSPQGMTAGYKTDDEKSSTSSRLNPESAQQVAVMATNGLHHNGDLTSPITLDLSSKADAVMDDHSPTAIKDDEDDDDDDVEDKIDNQSYDPERLKAFNMFVRLFVDENLDRMVPISRQPREKVQAIIDSCLRQFPEFGERARKRIRTYLKSCRRHKRPRDGTDPVNGAGLLATGSNRPMPPHLTSAIAEHILAQACENENQNAKRLRLGLEPISQPLPPSTEKTTNSETLLNHSPASQASSLANEAQHSPATTTSAPNLFRPAFGPYQRTSGHNTPAPMAHQGPTDLSTKSRSAPTPMAPISNGFSTNSNRASPLPHKLSPAEILAVRQLVTGYRESAAFLLRSADELEQLLLQQQSAL